MASKTFTMTCADGIVYRFTRETKQGRRQSPDPKTPVGLRLHNSTRARIAETGMSEQKFIEDAVYEKLDNVIRKLVKS